ncbi:hypothetical protein LAZ67_19001040 [Cordylochernes scorpioides]|uniref:Transposase n=1 Tax=Cordylochernes scorpioides TaxID=51811 RepID=A0ABY6LHG1_9ARAC|nr:hypothetical protein LAZ67_19001040 [Cordylochernes scorpioides]
MEAPLKDCTTLEQCAVIRFLNAEGIQTSQICQRMKNIYGESCLSQKTFINGLTSSKMDELHVPILSDLDDQVQRVNSDLYCDILVNKLKPGIKSKRRGKLSKGVLFLHDNARPHTSCKTVSTIIKLEHPAYSPDLAPSDYFLFGLLKKELKGKRFDSDEDVQKVVQDFFHTLPKSAYKEGIYKLPERWRRCIESQAIQYRAGSRHFWPPTPPPDEYLDGQFLARLQSSMSSFTSYVIVRKCYASQPGYVGLSTYQPLPHSIMITEADSVYRQQTLAYKAKQTSALYLPPNVDCAHYSPVEGQPGHCADIWVVHQPRSLYHRLADLRALTS